MSTTMVQRLAAGGVAAVVGLSLAGGAVAAAAQTAPAVRGSAPATKPAAVSTPMGQMIAPMPVMPLAQEYSATLWQLRDNQLESTFLGGMIEHHKAAIAMAQLEIKRGKHPELITMADNIIASQRHEITQMTAALKYWYGLSPEQAVTKAPQPASQQIRQLDADMQKMVESLRGMPAGDQFDRAFLQRMVPHHQMAVIEAQPAQSFATHAPLRLTADAIISSQVGEVATMLDWLRDWYGKG